MSAASNGTSTWKLKPTVETTRDDEQDEPQLPIVPGVRECAAQAVDDACRRVALDGAQLLLADDRERGQDGEEADRIDDEAQAGSDGGDDDARRWPGR